MGSDKMAARIAAKGIMAKGWMPWEGMFLAPVRYDSNDIPEVALFSPGDPPGELWLQWSPGDPQGAIGFGPDMGDAEIYVRLDRIKQIPTPAQATEIIRMLGGDPPDARPSDEEELGW